MTKRTQKALAFARAMLVAGSLTACGGHTIDLNQASATSTSDAGSTAGDETLLDLKDDAALLSDIFVDDTRLYWINLDGYLRGCLKDNCARSVSTYANVISKNVDQWSPDVAVGGGYVYWFASDGTLYSCKSSGCGNAPTKIIRDARAAMTSYVSMRADGAYVYWVSGLDLYRCPASGCGVTPEVVAAGEGGLPVFANGNAYWIDYDYTHGDVYSSAFQNTIRTAPEDGSSPPSTIVTDSVGSIAANSSDIYWTNFSNHVFRCPQTGCVGTPTTVDASDTVKGYLKVDDTGLYWREDPVHDGPLHFCALPDCSTGSVVLTPPEVISYALDSKYVYWVDGVGIGLGDGTEIHRLAR